MEKIVEEINKILDCSKKYLIDYIDELKSKVDFQYVNKLQKISNSQLKEEISNEWNKFIKIIDKSLVKSINNNIPNELIIEANHLFEIIQQIENSNDRLESIKQRLQSHLLANDSCVVIYFSQRLDLIEDKLDPSEVEW